MEQTIGLEVPQSVLDSFLADDPKPLRELVVGQLVVQRERISLPLPVVEIVGVNVTLPPHGVPIGGTWVTVTYKELEPT